MKYRLEDLDALANTCLVSLEELDIKTATLVALQGDLGAGKTTFSQHLIKKLCGDVVVTSPTFVVMKKYSVIVPSRFRSVVHIDAYRLTKPEEIRVVHWSTLLGQSDTLILLEWPEKVETELPHNVLKITFKVVDETSREITSPLF